MTGRLTALCLTALLLAALLAVCGCTVPEDGGAAAPETASAPADGTMELDGTEPLNGTETLYGDDIEVLAVGPELTRSEERGRMIFLHYCAHCHGPSGAGDGQNSYGLETPPRDLLAVEMDALSDEHLRKVITEGGAANGLSPLMPPWGHTLEPHRINDLVALIRVLPNLEGFEDEDADIPTLDDDDEMDDFSL